MKRTKLQAGFTLIELIAVMVILAILAAVVIPRITSVQEGAYESNVINMHGAIRNYVSNQALRNAISGGTGMEVYDEPTVTDVDYYIKLWIKDYDDTKWTQSHGPAGGTSDHGTTDDKKTPDAILFEYHPHGAGVLKDIYFIEYFPATSPEAEADAYDYDGFELIAYKDRTSAAGGAAADQDDDTFVHSDVGRALERQIVGAVEDRP
tara:strand:+ start:159 stop:779 length:621 start_codon:yes stop_codon:yes gene_type:complete